MLKRSSRGGGGGGRNLSIEFNKLSTIKEQEDKRRVSKRNQVTVIIEVGETQKSAITGLVKDWS